MHTNRINSTHITHQSWLSTGFVVQGPLRNTIQLIFRENRLERLSNTIKQRKLCNTQHWYIPYNACTYSLSSTYCTSPVIQNSWTRIFITNWYLYVLTIEYISYNVCAYSLSSTYCTNPVVQISFVYINVYIYIHTHTHQYSKRGCVSGEFYFYLYTLRCGHIDESLTHT